METVLVWKTVKFPNTQEATRCQNQTWHQSYPLCKSCLPQSEGFRGLQGHLKETHWKSFPEKPGCLERDSNPCLPHGRLWSNPQSFTSLLPKDCRGILITQTYIHRKAWVKFNSLEQELNPGLPHHRQQSCPLRYPVCFSLKGLEMNKCIWNKHTGKSSEKFYCQERELNLGLPHASRWFNPLSYSPVLGSDCTGVPPPPSSVNGDLKKQKQKNNNTQPGTATRNRTQVSCTTSTTLYPTSYDICCKVKAVEGHKYL